MEPNYLDCPTPRGRAMQVYFKDLVYSTAFACGWVEKKDGEDAGATLAVPN